MADRTRTPKRTPPKGARHRSAEFRFKIEAFTPTTMPMVRLTEYLKELATILGEPRDVHLVAIEAGSTVPVLQVEYESIPKVQERAAAVRRGTAPRDPSVAFRRVNEMLREDNGRAVFQRGKKGARILEFPGRDETEEGFANVRQYGSLDGEVIRVGGIRDRIWVTLESEGKPIAGCETKKEIAKRMGKHLFEPVRVHGMGSWTRNAEGEWGLNHFRIDDFEPLESLPLSDALATIREIPAEWGDRPYEDVMAARRGEE